MSDLEEILRSELHDVAGGLDVPPLPGLPDRQSRRRWLPVLAAAAVLVIVLGVVAVTLSHRDGTTPEPAPPTPTPTETKSTAPPVEVSTAAPEIPYTVDGHLYVDGEQVPGTWWYLSVGGPTWLAMRADDSTWWWGRGPDPQRIETTADAPPVLSPDGLYIAVLSTENGGTVVAFDTDPAGEGLGGAPVDLGDRPFIRAVTSDGKVIVRGDSTSIMWSVTGESSPPVQLSGPDVLSGTTAGLVVTDGDESATYLAEVSDDGTFTKIGDLPGHDVLAVAPGGEVMAWTPLGTLGGEVTSIGSLEAGTVDGGQRMTFTPPDGWAFKVQDWAWEDDDNLVSTVVKTSGAERMVRCSVLTGGCVLIDAP